MRSLDIRELAISHYKDGKTPSEIEECLNYKVPIKTIYRWTTAFKNYGHCLPKFSPGRPRTARTKRLRNSVKNRLKSKNRRKTLRTMAADFKTNIEAVKRTIKDLGMNCYRKIPVQKLKSDHVLKRKQCCTWMRKHLR